MAKVHLYNSDLLFLGQLESLISAASKVRVNAAGSGSFEVPSSEAVDSLKIASNIAIYSGTKKRLCGVITNRDFSGENFRFTVSGHESRLSQYKTPQMWLGWNGQDLADVVKDHLNVFKFKRYKTKAEWDSARTKYQVDTATDPGSVFIQYESHPLDPENERPKSSGYLEFRIDLGDKALSGGRIARWAETIGDDVRITIQSRSANTEALLNAKSWSAEKSAAHVDEVAENETIGVSLAGDGRWLDVKVNLYTNDRETPNKDHNNEILSYGSTPELRGLEIIWREPSEIIVGDIPVSTGITVNDYEFDRTNFLRSLSELCGDYGYEFRVRHDVEQEKIVLDLAQEFGAHYTKETADPIILRHGDNAAITVLKDDSYSLVNVLHCWGAGNGPDQLYVELRDINSIQEYGEYHDDFDDQEAEEIDDLITSGERELAKRSLPNIIFSVDDYHDRRGSYGLCDWVTVVHPKTGLVVDVKIEEERWSLTSSGELITLGLGGLLLNPLEPFLPKLPSHKLPKIITPALRGVRAAGYYGYITVSWYGEGTSYAVRYRKKGEIEWNNVRVNQRKFLHSDLVPGDAYEYQVAPITNKKLGDWSHIVYAVVRNVPAEDVGGGTDPPDTPIWQTSEFINDVTLRWHPANGAVLYELRTNTNWGEVDGLIVRGNNTWFRFRPMQRSYTFYLRAINGAGVYSEGTAQLTLTKDAPGTPNSPIVTGFFSALWIEIQKVDEVGIQGYNVYVTPVDALDAPIGPVEIVPYSTAARVIYEANPGTRFKVEVKAFDIIGEGNASLPIYGETAYIDEDDLPDEVIKARHVTTGQLITLAAQIKDAIITSAKIISINASKIVAGLLRSVNWGTDAGTEIDLDTGTIKVGGSVDPKLSWDGSKLKVKGSIEAGNQNVFINEQGISVYKGEEKSFEADAQGNVSMQGTIAAESGWISDNVTIGAGGPTLGSIGGSAASTQPMPSGGKLFPFDKSYRDVSGGITFSNDEGTVFVPGKFREGLFTYDSLSCDLGELLSGDYTVGAWMSDTIDAPYPTITVPIDLASGTHDGTEVVDGELRLLSQDQTAQQLASGLYTTTASNSGYYWIGFLFEVKRTCDVTALYGGSSATGFRYALYEADEDLKPIKLLSEKVTTTTRRYRSVLSPVIRLVPGVRYLIAQGRYTGEGYHYRVSSFPREALLQNNPIISWISDSHYRYGTSTGNASSILGVSATSYTIYPDIGVELVPTPYASYGVCYPTPASIDLTDSRINEVVESSFSWVEQKVSSSSIQVEYSFDGINWHPHRNKLGIDEISESLGSTISISTRITMESKDPALEETPVLKIPTIEIKTAPQSVEPESFSHIVVRSDGARFLNGTRNDLAEGLSIASGVLTLAQRRIYDDLIVVPYSVSDEAASKWFSNGSRFDSWPYLDGYAGAGVKIGADGVTVQNADGGYSRLTSNTVAFFEPGSEVPSHYVRRAAMGTASDGEWVELGWQYSPKAIVSIKNIQTYSGSASADLNQVVNCFISPDPPSPEGFYVYAVTSVMGGSSEYLGNLRVPGYTMPPDEIISPYSTGEETQRLKAVVKLSSTDDTWSYWVNYSLYYQKEGSETWIGFGSGKLSVGPGESVSRTHNSSYLDLGNYRVKMIKTDQWDSSLKWNLYVSVSAQKEQMLYNGEVTWHAVEGGAE